MQSAVATSLGTIFFSSLASVFSHHRRRAVLWEVLPWLGIGALGGTLVGAQIASVFSAAFLAVSFGLFQLLTAWKIFFPGNAALREERPSRIFYLGSGSAIGLLSSFLGVGGGFLTVPLLLTRGFPVHAAVGTSAGIGFFIALGGILGFSFSGMSRPELPPGSLGFVYLPACLASAVTSLFLAPLGARFAHSLNQSILKKIFGSVVLVLGILMLKKSWDLWQVETLLK